MQKRFAQENFSPEIQAKADRMNLEESQVPAYTLPAILPVGVQNGIDFQTRARPFLLGQLEKYLYGVVPPPCQEFRCELTVEQRDAFAGLATKREFTLHCRQNGLHRALNLLVYLPNQVSRPAAVFLGLNFKGNAACSTDPGVIYQKPDFYPSLGTIRYADSRATEAQRGTQASSWEFEQVLKRGYAAATMCYYDVYPDRPDGFENSIMRLFYQPCEWSSPERNSGAISAWAWGISRAIDCLLTQPEIDGRRIIVHGHSRLGKTALWAGANDQRIALTVSNCSGTCGAKLAKRIYGENYEWILTWNPHWLRGDFSRWSGREDQIPVDQHQLLALLAPRLLYIASASEDVYADPKGEFLAARAASEAYALFGSAGLETAEQPVPGQLTCGDIGYYLRRGEHAVTPENWQALLDYCDRKLGC
ncbi:MAG: acetylxylan esterase [Oligosphaeraceae bacterium]|nr:acetylxylan esterase [Oligosphaeraceae bacterium]